MLKKIFKITGLIFLALLLIGGLFVYNLNSNLEKLNHAELVESSSTNDTIPFKYSNSGHILIDVKFKNKNKPLPFILDSGASNMIFKKYSSKFDLVTAGYSMGIGSNGNIFWSSIDELKRIKIGGFQFQNLHAKIVDFNLECIEAYGIIGIGTMRHLVWQLDFKNNIIIISKELKETVNNKSKYKFDLNENNYGHQLSMPLKISNKSKFNATIDLGNNLNLSIDEDYLKKDSLNLNFKTINGRGSTGLGDSKETTPKEKFYLIDNLYFLNTDYEIQDFPVIANENSLNLLGLGFFKKYKTTISWKDRKLILEPYDSVQNFKWKTFGLSTRYMKDENKIIINSLIDNSPSSDFNLTIGAEIHTLNNRRILNHNEYCKMRSELNNRDTINLQIKTLDTVKNLQIIKQPIF